MKIIDYKEVIAEVANMEGAKGVKVRWLISDKDKAPNFAMRLFEVEPGDIVLCIPMIGNMKYLF